MNTDKIVFFLDSKEGVWADSCGMQALQKASRTGPSPAAVRAAHLQAVKDWAAVAEPWGFLCYQYTPVSGYETLEDYSQTFRFYEFISLGLDLVGASHLFHPGHSFGNGNNFPVSDPPLVFGRLQR